MRNFSNMYVVQDDELWIGYFDANITPDSLRNQTNLSSLIAKLVSFHNEYVNLSQKHQICEIIPRSFLQKKDINIKAVYQKQLNIEYNQNNCLTFFPCWEDKNLDIKVRQPSSSLLKLPVKNQLYFDYFYSSNFTYINSLKEAKLDNISQFESYLLRISPNALDTKSEFYSNSSGLFFTVEIYSDLWFETVSRNRRLWDKSYGEPYLDYDDEEREEPALDNRYIAYRNTPRFNSFLRDLKTLFVDKYGWSYDSDYDDLRRDGIPLDGKIIYQEDIDEGRVKLPDIESFGKVVEAGQYF